jgi:GT2 family glycosyltransferase
LNANIAMHVVHNPINLGLSAARNVGTRAARGRYVLFTDSDCIVGPNWIEALSGALIQPGVAAASGSVSEPPPRNLAEYAFHGTTRIGRGMGQHRALVGNNMGFVREVVATFRFDDALRLYCDDDDVARRLLSTGHRIEFVAAATILHDHRLDLFSYLRMGFHQGMGSGRYWYKHGQYIGRDVIALVLCLSTLPLALLHSRFLVPAALFFFLQLSALVFAEIVYKGKKPLAALAILPLQLVYICWKVTGIFTLWLRLALGREKQIVASRQAWRSEIRQRTQIERS